MNKTDTSIPDGITEEHIRNAVVDFNTKSVSHSFKHSTTYDVIIDGDRYPPKAIVGLAARYILGKPLTPADFGGGLGTKCFRVLNNNGFHIVLKSDDTVYPDDVKTTDVHYEGAVTKTIVNRYERDSKARDKCIEYYGLKCQICFFDFEKVYGELGAGFIHVHHIVPIANIKQEYKINPIKDLIPVCPNCHSMLHKKNPPLAIETLKKILN